LGRPVEFGALARRSIVSLQRQWRDKEAGETTRRDLRRVIGISDATVRREKRSSPAAGSDNPKQERNGDRVQGRLPCPASQAIKRRSRASPLINGLGKRLSRSLDSFPGRLNGLLGPI
jgi:hypothetical protein